MRNTDIDAFEHEKLYSLFAVYIFYFIYELLEDSNYLLKITKLRGPHKWQMFLQKMDGGCNKEQPCNLYFLCNSVLLS